MRERKKTTICVQQQQKTAREKLNLRGWIYHKILWDNSVWNVETLLQRLSCAEVIFVKCESKKQNNIIKPPSFLLKMINLLYYTHQNPPKTSAPCC